MINIAKEYNTDKSNPITNKYYFDIIPEAVLFPITLNSLTNGQLSSGVVQYCFQLFNKRGTESTVSSLSNLIPLSKDLRNGESKKRYGQLSGESSGLGCVLNIKFNNTGEFDKLRIIRIHYKDNTSIPDIYNINEISISTENKLQNITYTDNGSQFVNKINYDEFNALIPYDFTAKSITKLHNRLFASNVTENTWDVKYDARAYRCDASKNVKLLSSDGNIIENTIDYIIGQDDVVPEDHDCINPYNLDITVDS